MSTILKNFRSDEMKKVLLGLFLLASVLSFAAGRVLKDRETEVREGIVYMKGENKPYTGTLEEYNEKGILVGRKVQNIGRIKRSNRRLYILL